MVITRKPEHLKEPVINGQNLYPSRNYKRFKGYCGNIHKKGNWYTFTLWNQLPGLIGDGLCVEGFCGHYNIRFNPEIGQIQYLKFADYGSLTYVVDVVGEVWETPENPILCTYLRKLCRDAWEGAYISKIVEVTLDEDNHIKYKRCAPVNIHTGEAYQNCYCLLVE